MYTLLCLQFSIFKKIKDHLPKDTYFGLYKEATCGNSNCFLTYVNGKSITRVQGFRSICVWTVLIDGIITWNPQSKISEYVEFFC
jgi:hypothetical protein